MGLTKNIPLHAETMLARVKKHDLRKDVPN